MLSEEREREMKQIGDAINPAQSEAIVTFWRPLIHRLESEIAGLRAELAAARADAGRLNEAINAVATYFWDAESEKRLSEGDVMDICDAAHKAHAKEVKP